MSKQCCCQWGAAKARKSSDEWPEFECYQCPLHGKTFSQPGELCKRHRKERLNDNNEE